MVTIESEVSLGRPRHAAGTIVRVTGPEIVVKVASWRGVAHQERYRRGDGIRVGGLGRAELVQSDCSEFAATPAERQQVQHIHGLYRAWNRNRGDVESLRRLLDAIGNYLVARMGTA